MNLRKFKQENSLNTLRQQLYLNGYRMAKLHFDLENARYKNLFLKKELTKEEFNITIGQEIYAYIDMHSYLNKKIENRYKAIILDFYPNVSSEKYDEVIVKKPNLSVHFIEGYYYEKNNNNQFNIYTYWELIEDEN